MWRVVRRADGVEVGTLAPPEQYTGLLTIHGEDADETQFTLTEAFTSRRAGGKHRLEGTHAVVGGHLSSREHTFTGFRARLSHLVAWRLHLREPGWSSAHKLACGGSLSVMSAVEPPEVWVAGQQLPPHSLRGIDRAFLAPLLTLLTLASDDPCDFLAFQVHESSGDEWWDVYSSALRPERAEEPAAHRWLLRTGDLSLRNLAAWLANVERLGPLPPAVADLGRSGTISLESEVLKATTLAEGLHRRLYPRDTRFKDEHVAARAREAAVKAVAGVAKEAVNAVRGLLNHLEEPGYRARLNRLAEEGAAAVPGVSGTASKWKEIVYDARNDFAHRTTGFIGDDEHPVDRYLTVASSLRWLLQGLLLVNAGVESSKLTERFSQYAPYQIFLEQARYWQPDVYGEPADL
jgi:Apea-like HEPN